MSDNSSVVESELYPNYFVSNNGRIFRFRGVVLTEIRTKKIRYASFTACFNGKRKEALVHRAVAHAFCVGYKDGLVVNHKDGNPLNNNFENLEWVTQKQNIAHKEKTGTLAYGENHHNSKLTNEIVDYIRTSTKSCRQISRDTGLATSTIARARNRETWKR